MEYLFNFFLCFNIILFRTGIFVKWFKSNKLDPWQYSSVSINNNKLNYIDKSVLSIVNACFIDKNYIKNIKNSVKILKIRKKNLYQEKLFFLVKYKC